MEKKHNSLTVKMCTSTVFKIYCFLHPSPILIPHLPYFCDDISKYIFLDIASHASNRLRKYSIHWEHLSFCSIKNCAPCYNWWWHLFSLGKLTQIRNGRCWGHRRLSFFDDDDQDVDYNCEDVEDIDNVESRFGSEAAFRSQENIHSVTMKTLRGGKQQRQGCRERIWFFCWNLHL